MRALQSAQLCLQEGIQATEETMTLQFNRNPHAQMRLNKKNTHHTHNIAQERILSDLTSGIKI